MVEKTRKVGIYMPLQMANDLDYLAQLAGVSRSRILVDMVGPLLSDVAFVGRDMEAEAKRQGLNVEQMAMGPMALELFNQRLEEGRALMGELK